MQTVSDRLSPEWQQWIAENLSLGARSDELVEALRASGVSEALARDEIEAAAKHPFMKAARAVGRRYARLEALMDLYSELYRQSDRHQAVERRSDISPEEFFATYYFGHRPVVLQGFMRDWPALARWSLAHFREHFGDVEVEIMRGRDANPNYASDHDKHRATVRLAEFIQMIEEAGETNDFYMVPRNENWRLDGLRRLRDDIRAPLGIIDPALDPQGSTLLLGPAGTVTPLHHDNMNVLLTQVFGRKHVKLVPSFEAHRVYPRHGTFSYVDAAQPDASRYPDFMEASVVDVVLSPGEMLFIPVGWWHWVRALDPSATVSLHDFVVPEGNTQLVFAP